MNWIDIVVIVLVAISTLTGLRLGIIKAVLSLAGVVIGILLAGRYNDALANQLTFIPQATVANIAAFAIILLGIMIIAAVLAAVIKWIVSAVMLGWVNRLGGAAFGFIMGAVFCSAILAFWVKLLGPGDVINESVLAALLLDRFPLIMALLPGEFDAIRSFFQ